MRIFGVDPGIARCGWGAIQIENGKLKMENCGCVETRVGISIEKRLLVVYKEIVKLIEKYKPDSIAVEELFFNTNAKTALVVGQARGVVLLAAAEKDISVATYTPLQVKIAVTGYGKADKKQVGNMVKAILKLKNIPKLDDVSDALAVALTHAFTNKFK